MARTYARIATRIWTDPDFTALPPDAQWLQVVLLSQPGLSLVGVIPATPRRWATFAAGMTETRVAAALDALTAAGRVLTDPDTEEILVRGFMAADGILRSPNMVKAAVGCLADVVSPALAAAVRDEIPPDQRHLFDDAPPGDVPPTVPERVPGGVPATVPEGVAPRGRAHAGDNHTRNHTRHPQPAATPTPGRRRPAAGNGTGPADARVCDPDDGFDALWALWPESKRRRPTDARKAYDAALAAGATPDGLVHAAAAWIAWWAAEGITARYVPRPDTWLAGGDWAAPPPAPSRDRDAQLADVLDGLVNGHNDEGEPR